MTAITADNRDMWQTIGNDLALQRPSVGKMVRVTAGKHSGAEGRVTWHGRDKYSDTRYVTAAQQLLRDIEGRRGWRVRVQDEFQSFFVDANKVQVLENGG